MDERVPVAVRYGLAYPAGVVVAVVGTGLVAGVPATATGFLVTVVAAVVGLVALHDPQSPRRRARRSVRDDDEDGGEDVTDPAAALAGHAGSRDPDDESAPGQFDERSWRLLLFAVGLFVLGWGAFLLAGRVAPLAG